jgi:5-methylcytosine-specific restriction endonuclease McrA
MLRSCSQCNADYIQAKTNKRYKVTRCSFCIRADYAWVLRYCTWCGDFFGSRRRDAKMCSTECGALWAESGPSHFRSSERQETKTCAYCKKEFRTSNSARTHCDISCTQKDRLWKPEGMKAKGARSGYAQRRREAQRAGDKDLTTYTIWKAEGGHCRLCNKATIDPTTPRALKPAKRDAWASLDHIKPISAGGTHTWDNAQLLCYPCNSGKVHTDRDLWGGAVKILESVRATVPSDEFVPIVSVWGLLKG